MNLNAFYKIVKYLKRRDLNLITKQSSGCFATETVIKINIVFILRSPR
jgi:hypothetical protein